MAYSTDLRKRVLDFIHTGGKKSEASRRFSVNRSTIYRWLAAEAPFTPEKPGPKHMRCLDEAALKKHVADFPDLTQNERAWHFGVSASSIRYGLRKLGITRKKKHSAIRSGAPRNVKSIVKHSPKNTLLEKRSFMLMNAVFVLRVLDLMGMLRKVNVFSVSSQARGHERRRWSLRASVRLLRHPVCLTGAAMLRVSMPGLKPIYVHGCLFQTSLFLIMRRSIRRTAPVS